MSTPTSVFSPQHCSATCLGCMGRCGNAHGRSATSMRSYGAEGMLVLPCILSKCMSFGKCIYFVFFRPAFTLCLLDSLWPGKVSQGLHVHLNPASLPLSGPLMVAPAARPAPSYSLLPPNHSPVCPHSSPVVVRASTPCSPRHGSTPTLRQHLMAAY